MFKSVLIIFLYRNIINIAYCKLNKYSQAVHKALAMKFHSTLQI